MQAGIMIAIGCTVYCSCTSKVVGAVLFSVALLTICIKGYSLFTGKVGFIPEKHDKEAISVLLLGLLGNAIATVAICYAVRYAIPSAGSAAEALCNQKLEAQVWWQTLLRATMCGILMYVAVSIYRDKGGNISGILFCIPVFILSGFEHSVADIGYFAMSGIVSWQAFVFILLCLIGNSIGAVILPLLSYSRNTTKQ